MSLLVPKAYNLIAIVLFKALEGVGQYILLSLLGCPLWGGEGSLVVYVAIHYPLYWHFLSVS